MISPIAYDVLRLFIGPASLTPRGIDRVDIALARHIFSDQDVPHVGVLPTPMGVFALSAGQVVRLIAHLDSLWAEMPAERADSQLANVIEMLWDARNMPAGAGALPDSARHGLPWMTARMLKMLAKSGCLPWRSAAKAVPAGAHYVNVGQLGLAMPGFFNWLNKRPDIFTAMMIHDTIPIDFPDMVPASSPDYHRRMIATAASRADCMIYNSDHTRDSVNGAISALGQPCPPSIVRALPLPLAFAQATASDARLAATPYFLTVSTVEPRKNHALLLRVWRSIVAEMGDAAPHLLIVGSPGHNASEILSPIAADPALARRVHHIVGLSSATLATLLLGACGLLCPSLAEGFGLSLLEAEAMQVPAIASDIPSHREIAGAFTSLLSTNNDDSWRSAILLALELDRRVEKPRLRPPIPDRMTEAAYCTDLIRALDRIKARPRSPSSL